MPLTVFITGAGGFIGRALLQHLADSSANLSIRALTRRPRGESSADGPDQEVVGDLLDPTSYRQALEGCDTVVHLAAATGRAAPSVYQKVNVEGTRVLLEACKAAGVRHFLYVSTIAAAYPDKRYYPYARTKAQAERFVMESGLSFAIVRPTVVIGEASPIWTTLRKIAGMPFVPMLEGARPVAVQPVHAGDVVRGIELILSSGRFDGEILELGGPKMLPLRDFLAMVQNEIRGESSGSVLRVPFLELIRFLLAAVEPLLRPMMPVTAGQLSIFANDSTAEENSLMSGLRSGMPSLEETIAVLVDASHGCGSDPGGQPPRPLESRQMSDATLATLRAESRVFCAYLVGMETTPYIEEQYAKACHARGLAFDDKLGCLDRASLWLARRRQLLSHWADAYCAIFHRTGVLRRKLVVLAAILEHVTPTNEVFDRTQSHGVTRSVLSIVLYGCSSGLALLIGSIVLLPTSLICKISGRLVRTGVPVRQSP